MTSTRSPSHFALSWRPSSWRLRRASWQSGRRIGPLVYDLYGLTAEEIKMAEGKNQ